MMSKYDGYLSPYLDRICEMHETGRSTREIAEELLIRTIAVLGFRAE